MLIDMRIRVQHIACFKAYPLTLTTRRRSTVIEAGGNRSTESFDYGTGDIWLYGANEAHMVQGHQDGCTYLSGALQAAAAFC